MRLDEDELSDKVITLEVEVSRLQERVRVLEEGIRKHKETLHGPGKTWEWGGKETDAELYKLLEDK